MAAKFKEGDNAGGFIVEKHITSGNYAISYLARDAAGTKVFLKQYKKPSSTSGWLDGFISYQTTLHDRISADPLLNSFCVPMLEVFPTHRGLCQTFQFIEGGFDLQSCIERKSEFDWATRLIFAKVMLAALDRLHKASIVHTDLKPPNLMILPDPSIKMGYKLRLIDMDFSVLTDRKAPWDGFEGYVSSPGYSSPEHIRGEIPVTASDVFTCGIILSELLGDGHPLRELDATETDLAISRCKGFRPARLERDVPGGLPKAEIEAEIQRCFSSAPDDRPTCADLLAAFTSATKAPVPKAPPASKPTAPDASNSLVLENGSGANIAINITSELGRRNFASWGEDSKYLSSPQFRIIAGKPGVWRVSHCPEATNATLLNGKELSASMDLKNGMVLSVGNPAKGIDKFPITVRIP